MAPRHYDGPAFLSFGFRPFFLLAAIAAALLVPVWLTLFMHGGELAGVQDLLRWHIHEMLFGYLAAVIGGFLLTAIPNWTGRLPVAGKPLLLLVIFWLGGRIAPFLPLAGPLAAFVDMLFLPALAFVAAREVIAGWNWRNLPVCGILAMLALANGFFHLETLGGIGGDHAVRLGLGLVVLLNALIGGRIVPSFTTNWLIKAGRPERPVPFSQYDKFLLLATVPALLAWVVWPFEGTTGVVLLAIAGAHLVRLGRWKGWATISSAIVIVLHVAYLWLPIGLGLLGLGLVFPDIDIPPSAGVHALTAGLMGLMPLAVMSRATLGHTGRPLAAGAYGAIMYGAVCTGAILRVWASLAPANYTLLLALAGAFWCLGFLMFALKYGWMLLAPRATA